jgi:hypothetical protein
MTSSNPLRSFLLCTLLLGPAAPASAATAPVPVPKDRFAIQQLNPSNPEHAAILRWHHALLANDFQAYLRASTRNPQISEQMMEVVFEGTRRNTPPSLLIYVNPQHTNPNGSKEYAVVGCMKLPGDPREIRMISLVSTLQQDGQWKVFGTAFGPPWTDQVRVCPVKPT